MIDVSWIRWLSSTWIIFFWLWRHTRRLKKTRFWRVFLDFLIQTKRTWTTNVHGFEGWVFQPACFSLWMCINTSLWYNRLPCENFFDNFFDKRLHVILSRMQPTIGQSDEYNWSYQSSNTSLRMFYPYFWTFSDEISVFLYYKHSSIPNNWSDSLNIAI